jgi:hypothetical protein
MENTCSDADHQDKSETRLIPKVQLLAGNVRPR